MGDLQATVEIAVDLGRFHNVDLFQRGFYQVSVRLIEPVHPNAKVEVHLLKSSKKDQFCSARVCDRESRAVSKVLQVLYKREECYLNHAFLFRVHCLLDSQKIMECMKKINFQLEATLCFSSDDPTSGLMESMEEVSKRTLQLEMDLMHGLYANTLVIFDYGYMAAVEFTIHASLVALHQPLMTMPGVMTNAKTGSRVEPATLESILFRPLPGMSKEQALNDRIRKSNAIIVHGKLINILLTVYSCMQKYYLTLMRTLPKKNTEAYVPVDVSHKLQEMTSTLKGLNFLDEIVDQVNMNLASTCSLLLALWSYVLDTSCLSKQVRKFLNFKYHKQRIQRFQSGFFTLENPRNSPFDENRNGIYNWMANEMRNSKYFTELPEIPIHNKEADGILTTLPIIFEDVYSHQCKKLPDFKPGFVMNSNMSGPVSPIENDDINGYLNASDEMESTRSGMARFSEFGENSVGSERGSRKKKKYPSIFRKRRGSYKPSRLERISVSDDESTKVTLSEFLSSIGNEEPPDSQQDESSAFGQDTPKCKCLQTQIMLPSEYHFKTLPHEQSNKRHSYHRRSLDERAQRLSQLVSMNMHSSCHLEDCKLSRSASYSTLDKNKSQPCLETPDGGEPDEKRMTNNVPASSASSVLSSVHRAQTNRKVEKTIHAQLRSEISEEPESGISEKTIAMSFMNTSLITVTTSVKQKKVPPNSNHKGPTRSTTQPLPKTVEAHHANEDHLSHGMIKSESFATGMERLQQGLNESDSFPRPHTHVLDSIYCDPSQTQDITLGGVDRVCYGSGLRPGGGTVTTSDLTPFDEPEVIQAWGQVSTMSNQENPSTVTLSPNKSEQLASQIFDDVPPLESKTIESEKWAMPVKDSPTKVIMPNVDDAKSNDTETLFLKPDIGSVTNRKKDSPTKANLPVVNEAKPHESSPVKAEKLMFPPQNEISISNGRKSSPGSSVKSFSLPIQEMRSPTKEKNSGSPWKSEPSSSTDTDSLTSILPIRTEKLRRHVSEKNDLFARLNFPGYSYTEIPPAISLYPYLNQRQSTSSHCNHLVVCVHGLDGNSNDLRLVRTYIQLAMPSSTGISFLMSRANEDNTYADIESMTERLVAEILDHLQMNFNHGKSLSKISFIGHSLGCLLIRSVVAHQRMHHLRSKFHTFLSFSGPHLGTIFNNSALVNTGLWLIQKWKKSACLLQLACKDHADLRKTYVYKLSKKKGLEFFRNILLVASASDRYVPYHSARIEMCKQAFRDKTLGPPYQEMVNNILKPVLNSQKLNLVRYHVVHALPSATANAMIGRAAHIAVLDSEVFLEKFLLVAAMKYFV